MQNKDQISRIGKILNVVIVLGLLLSTSSGTGGNLQSVKALAAATIFTDPLYQYEFVAPPGWNVLAPNLEEVSASKIAYGATIIQNFDSNMVEKENRKPENIQVQIGLGPMNNSSFSEWIQNRVWEETKSPDFINFNYQASIPQPYSLGTYKGYAFTITNNITTVLEIDFMVNNDLVVSIGLTPADSSSISTALSMLSTLNFNKTSITAKDFISLPNPAHENNILLLTIPDSQTKDWQSKSIEPLIVHDPGWGSEAPDSPISLFMPFHDGETWIVGGGGYFYGDGTHSNGNNDYYATDWNMGCGSTCDLGKEVLPVAGGNVIARQILPCPTTGYGCYVSIDHGNGITTLYGHLSAVMRDLGGVNHWDVVGQVGTTGNSTAPHLHLRFRQNGYSTCRNNGNTCPNGGAPAAQQSAKPSPMNTQQGNVQLNDGYSYTSNNKSIASTDCNSISGSGIKLFEGTSCTGSEKNLSQTGFTNLPDFNDQASSIYVSSGWSAKVFQDNDKNGSSRCINGNMWDLSVDYYTSGDTGRVINNDISSVDVFNNSSCTTTSNDPPAGFTWCANEGNSNYCTFSGIGDVAYGANGQFYYKTGVNGSILCSNDVFGDPISGVGKSCYYKITTSPPNSPSLTGPGNGQFFNEGEAINLSWSPTGSDYYGEVWGGPGGTLTFGWQTGISKNIGSQWAGNTYSWHVKARNGAGESGWSETRTFTVRPGAPSNLSASAASCSQINLSWADNSGNEDGHKVYRNGTLIATLGSGVTSYQNTGLSGNTNYSYTVNAYRGSIESNPSNTANATTQTCANPPSALSLSSPGNGSSNPYNYDLNFQWNASSGATGYQVEWWGGPYSTMQPCTWTSATSCHIGVVAAGNTYSWHVKARNSVGESGWSNTSTFTIQPAPFDDSYEENDTLATSYDLSLRRQTWLSTISGYGIQSDEDWYGIYVSPGFEKVLVDLRFTHNQGDIDIALYNSAGNSLAISESASDNEYINYTVPASGVYYLKVYYGNAGNQYNLWWDNINPAQTLSVTSVTRINANPTKATSVNFMVTFSNPATGVDKTDFTLSTTGGITNAKVSKVSGAGANYVVTIGTGSSSGTLNLNLMDNDSIKDASLIPLGGVGAGNGNFTSGETYIIDKTKPLAVSITRADASPTRASSVNFTVIFSEPVTGVDVKDFKLITSYPASKPIVSSVSGSGATYTVTASTGTGTSLRTIRLDLIKNNTIKDGVLNSLGAGFTSGQVYTVDKPPVVVSILRGSGNPTSSATVKFKVKFSETVTGVTVDDFQTFTTLTGISIVSVTGSGMNWVVTVNTGTGSGSLRLDLFDNDSIYDVYGNTLGGTGAVNGDYMIGQSYTVR